MKRSMSYRKPVPVYIPSPPSSPQATFPPSTQRNLDLEVPPVRVFYLFSPLSIILLPLIAAAQLASGIGPS
jgi:hypothetical protein